MKRCQSCGRLIELLEDFAGLDQSSNYCSSCADDCGKLMSLEEVLENLTQRIAKTDGFDESASRNAALQILGRQPAWEPKFRREEKVKKNKKSMLLIFVTIALVLMTSFITILVTNLQKDFWEQQFDRYSSSYQNPLENIVSYVSNGWEITEFKCKGNQNIEQLQNGILQFSSLEALIKSNINNKLIIPDKSNYVYNIKTGKSLKIGSYSSYSPKETNDEITKIKNVIGDNLSELTWNEPCITFDGVYKQNEIENISLQSVFGNTEIIFLISNLDVKRNKLKSELYKQTTDKNVIFRDESTTIVSYPSPVNDFNQPSKIHLYKGNKSTSIASFDIGYRYASLYDKIGNKIIIKLEKKYMGSEFQLAVVDLDSSNYVELINKFDTEKTKLLAGSGIVYYVDDYVGKKVIMFDLINGTSKTFSEINSDCDLVGVFNDEKGIKLLLSKQINDGFPDKQYYVYKNYSNEYKTLITGNYDMLLIQENCIVYADHINKDKNGLPIDKKQMVRIIITDINNAKSTVLSEDVPVSEKISLFSDGTYIAWTRNAGPKDNQWKNVCFTKLP